MVYLGLLLGLALLTKITAWAILPVVVIFLAINDSPWTGKRLGRYLKTGLLFAVIRGDFGMVLWTKLIHFGRPFLINWKLPGSNGGKTGVSHR